jgi:glutamate-1-semialdehyde 2,1-aminomutase
LDHFERAKLVIPGGVNSPVRSWKAVGGKPLFIRSGDGSRVTDESGKSYLDFVCSWGPLVLGHAPKDIQQKLVEAISEGTTFGAPTLKEVELADLVAKRIPSVEKVRLVSSGTEATMSAVRLARGFTGRTKILKFDGCYHGHVDSLLVKAVRVG